VAGFYSARSETIPPLPWPSFAPPFPGVGLAIVKTGVERMDGTLGVESSLGIGSRFWIEFQAARSAAPKDEV
jgi:light-regulated signal transduction histidine kinase (bacteriophytochrome)